MIAEMRETLEAVLGPVEDDAEQRDLSRSIRAGDVPAGTLERVKEDVGRKREIASPRYLERYE